METATTVVTVVKAIVVTTKAPMMETVMEVTVTKTMGVVELFLDFG